MTGKLGILALAAAISMVGCDNMNRHHDHDGHDHRGHRHGDHRAHGDMHNRGGNLASADHRFLMDAATSGDYEVQAGKKAAAKGGNDYIRNLGKHMVADHQKANEELLAIAQRKGVMMPPPTPPRYRDMLNKLDMADAPGFNDEYLRQQEVAHREAISMFETQANSGGDPEIKGFAQRTLPTLREHLKMITDRAAMGAPTGPGPGKGNDTRTNP
jgi:putative membrane protein